MFQGSLTALITPFRGDKVDVKAFQDLCDWQITEGSHGLVPAGTTGESPTLDHAEHQNVVELCLEVAKGRVPILAGTGSNSTKEAIRLTQHAERKGASGALIVTPYYNKPTQEGLYHHFKAIHDATDLPIVIYNVPPRSMVDMSIKTMQRLAELPRIVGVKDATADLARPLMLRMALEGEKFCQLSGEDATALPFLAQGGVGCISVTANIAPRLLAEMHTEWQKGQIVRAMEINQQLAPLHAALFSETNPVPVKYAASLLDKSTDETRLPLSLAKDETKEIVRRAMHQVGLLN